MMFAQLLITEINLMKCYLKDHKKWKLLLIMCLLLCHKSKQKYVIDDLITTSKMCMWCMQDWYSDGKNLIISMKQKQKLNAVKKKVLPLW